MSSAEPMVSEERAVEAFRAYVASLPVPDLEPLERVTRGRPRDVRRWLVPALAAAVVALLVWIGGGGWMPRPVAPEWSSGSDAPTLPDEIAVQSKFTSYTEPGIPERAILVYHQGHGVEFLDVPQFMVLSADGDVYRRVQQAQDLHTEVSGFPPSRLSPDGRRLALGRSRAGGDSVDVLTFSTGDVRSFDLPTTGSEVVPAAWSEDGRVLWLVIGEGRADPRTRDSLARVDLETGEVARVEMGLSTGRFGVQVSASPDQRWLAVTDGDTRERLVDTTTLRAVASWDLPGQVVHGGWSPDGRLLVTRTDDRLYLHDVDGLDRESVPGNLEVRQVPIPFKESTPSGPSEDYIGPLLGWTSPTSAIFGRNLNTGSAPMSLVEIDLESGDVRTLTRIPKGWTGAGVTSMSMATGLAAGLEVRPAGAPERGPRRLVFLLGLTAALGAPYALRRWRRRTVQQGRVPESAF